jgi:hypothetical protein
MKTLNPWFNPSFKLNVDKKSLNPWQKPARKGLNKAFDYNGETDYKDFTNDNEQGLVKNLITEQIQQYGYKFAYIPRKLKDIDIVLGEQPGAVFKEIFEIEGMIENPEAVLKKEESFIPLGFWMEGRVKVFFSYDRFLEEIKKFSKSRKQPHVGDLLHFKLPNIMLQITNVASDEELFKIGTPALFGCDCQVFDKDSESFDTGEETVDNIEEFEERFLKPFMQNEAADNEAESVSESPAPVYWDLTRK